MRLIIKSTSRQQCQVILVPYFLEVATCFSHASDTCFTYKTSQNQSYLAHIIRACTCNFPVRASKTEISCVHGPHVQWPYFLQVAIGVSHSGTSLDGHGRSLDGHRAEEGTVQAVRLVMSTRNEVQKVDAGRYPKDHVLCHLNATRLV